ncbi:xylose isomerase-like TIM barrel protein [Saccharothrix carnea]|uniref:Xylose isomerase-like TIM barrel protein n=1 Tax=Saccharothrix carnea TaxID=1280637 RepID=A0A2P8I1F1_SACCR|nr:metabolite traffic protein EboE [Saccharothrix carnea]PSL52283.1 xylose isomerase-like TIM barrel protein [Saccharothrix carnea]
MSSIAYCTNVHPAEDLAGVVAQLDRYAVPVREELGVDTLALGLWLAEPVARGLAADGTARRRLAADLRTRGLEVSTLNAFPYGGFHHDVVKHSVYEPPWTDHRRTGYTIACAVVLADLLPDSADYGSISTLPLAWREPWSRADDARAQASLDIVGRFLRDEAARHGRPIRLAVEPEPGCVLDTVADAVSWLADRVDHDHIGICLDTCHLAVSFADPAETVKAIRRSGLSVVKVQASAALEVAEPGTEEGRRAIAAFAEPRYLHQVRENTPGGVLAADDLPEALDTLPAAHPWRVHFHVPLHARPAAPLTSTTDVLLTAVDAVRSTADAVPHVEVETYTWNVLPDPVDDLAAGIAAELRWAADHLGGVA